MKNNNKVMLFYVNEYVTHTPLAGNDVGTSFVHPKIKPIFDYPEYKNVSHCIQQAANYHIISRSGVVPYPVLIQAQPRLHTVLEITQVTHHS